MSKSLLDAYFDHTQELQQRVLSANQAALPRVGEVIGRALSEDGVLHTFGSGHSAILARELVHRAGGLVPVSIIADPTGGWPEKIPGYGAGLFARYCQQYGFNELDPVIVISNSGRNPSPIEIARAAKEAGGVVIAITGMPMSTQTTSLHPSGLRLFEVADYVLDTLGVSGDAVLEVPGEAVKTGPVSSISGVLLLNLVSLAAIDWMVANGHRPPLLCSANIDGGAEANARQLARYQGRLCRPI